MEKAEAEKVQVVKAAEADAEVHLPPLMCTAKVSYQDLPDKSYSRFDGWKHLDMLCIR